MSEIGERPCNNGCILRNPCVGGCKIEKDRRWAADQARKYNAECEEEIERIHGKPRTIRALKEPPQDEPSEVTIRRARSEEWK